MPNISKMTIWELMEYVLDYPEYIGDSYFRSVSKEINQRFEELKREQTTT